MIHLYEKIFSIPKSLYVCLKLLPISQAVKMPIFVRYNTKCYSLKGKVLIDSSKIKERIYIGFQYVGTHDPKYQRTVLEIDGTIEFLGRAKMGSGFQLCVAKGAYLTIGDDFLSSCNGHLVCCNKVILGRRFRMGWDTLVMDSNFHSLVKVSTGEIKPFKKKVVVGDEVWIGTRGMVLAGAHLANGCVISANTVVNKRFETENSIIAGNPAAIVACGYKRHYEYE